MRKKLQHLGSLTILLLFGFTVTTLSAIPTYAASLTTTSITMNPDTEGVVNNPVINFTTIGAIPTNGTFALNFPSEFSLTGLVAGDITVAGTGITTTSKSISGNTVTVTITAGSAATGVDISVTFANSHITNPSTSGEYFIGILTYDSGASPVDNGSVKAVIDNANNANTANMKINAEVFQQCTMSLGTADIINLGSLVIGSDSIGSHDVTINCNAASFNFSLSDSVNGMYNGAVSFADATTAATNPTSATLASCVATNPQGCFGVHVTESYADTDLSCDSDLATATQYSGINDATAITACAGAGPVDANTNTITVAYGARITANSQAGVYTDTVTYTLAPTF